MMTIVGCDDDSPETSDIAHSSAVTDMFGPLWKIENTWKEHSTLYMTDAWLDEYLYDAVINRKIFISGNPSFLI
jgi:aminopeptidase C